MAAILMSSNVWKNREVVILEGLIIPDCFRASIQTGIPLCKTCFMSPASMPVYLFNNYVIMKLKSTIIKLP